MANLAIHPSEHVQEELEAMNLSPEEFAGRLGIPIAEFYEFMRGERDLTAEYALRLAHFFGISAEFWMGLQNLYDLRMAEQRNGDAIRALPTIKKLIAA